MLDLEHEIETASQEVEQRKGRINAEVEKLSSQIKFFTIFAWIFVSMGFIILVLSSWGVVAAARTLESRFSRVNAPENR